MPDCASDNGVAPNPGVKHPQAGTCAACPQNVWGSKTSAAGKAIRACSESKYLVVTPATEKIEEAASLQIPATSIKNFREYIAALNSAGLPANAVITQIEFGDTEYPSIAFTCVGYLTPEQQAQVSGLSATDEVQEAITVKEPKPLPTLTPAPVQENATGPITPIVAPPAVVQAEAPAIATGFGAPAPSQTPIVQPAVTPAPAPAVSTPANGFNAVSTPVVTELLPPEAPAQTTPVADAGSTDDLANILNAWSTKS
jgi:hypothetical protein